MKKLLIVSSFIIAGLIFFNIILAVLSDDLVVNKRILEAIARPTEFAFYAFVVILLGYGVGLGTSRILKYLKEKIS
jgi:hypothetical protein